MKKIMTFVLMLSCLYLFSSCVDKVDKNIAWPEWASRPVIADVAVKADRHEITAGETVKFIAQVHDNFNELKGYTLEIKYGNNVVLTKNGNLDGNEAVIDLDFVMPFAANLDAGGFYPEVTLTVVNSDNGTSVKRLANDSNVSVLRPSLPERLYIIDNNGRSFELRKGAGYVYSTSSPDLADMGASFHIAAKVSGNAPDFSDYVWGYTDGGIAIVGSAGNAIRTPDSEGKGFRNFGFDSYSFMIDKLVDYTVTLDMSKMQEQEQGGVTYLAEEKVRLIKDCEIVFEGFGDLKSMLQPDRFSILSGNTAKFTGHTQDWSIYYDKNDNWLIADYAVGNTSGQLWVTGEKACFPLGNDDSANELNWFKGDGKDRYATLAAIKDENGDFSLLVYLKEAFVIQLYRWIKWSTNVRLTSLTPEFGTIAEDGVNIRKGPDFTPGVYMLKVHITKEADANGDGTVADISLLPYTLK